MERVPEAVGSRGLWWSVERERETETELALRGESVDWLEAGRGWSSSSSAHRSPRWSPSWLGMIKGSTLVLLPASLGLILGLSSSTVTSSAEAATSSVHPSPGNLSFLSSLLASSPLAPTILTPLLSTASSVDPVPKVCAFMPLLFCCVWLTRRLREKQWNGFETVHLCSFFEAGFVIFLSF